MHFDRDSDGQGIGLGWRWRLNELLFRFQGVLLREDVAWALENGNVRRRVDKNDGVSKLKHFLSSGTGRVEGEQIERLLAYLAGQMGASDVRCISRPAENLSQFRTQLQHLRLAPAKPIAPRIELDALANTGRPYRDDRAQQLADDLWQFLDSRDAQGGMPSKEHKPVFMLYSEHNRAMQSFVRHLVECYSDEDPKVRSVIAVDARENDEGRSLALKLLGRSEIGRESRAVPVALATEVATWLREHPAIVVVTHFEPVLVGLSGAAVHAACRNYGFYDMFSRIVHAATPETRFIVLVDRRLTRVDASYLADVRLFTEAAAEAAKITPQYLKEMIGERRLEPEVSDIICESCRKAGRKPGDVLLRALAVAAWLDPTLDREWIQSVLDRNARTEVAWTVLQKVSDPIIRSSVLIAALAEDRLEFATLQSTLRQVQCCPGQDTSSVDGPCAASESDFATYVSRATEWLPDLVRTVVVEERDLGRLSAKALDLDLDFRRLLVDWVEQPGSSQEILQWCRRARVTIARQARADHLTLATRYPKPSPDSDPALFRRAILTVVLALGAIDPREPQTSSPVQDERRAASEDDGLDDPTATGQGLVKWAYEFIAKSLEGGRQYRLSQSYAGHQIKLQLWLCFQHLGFSRPQDGVRGPERRGPALSPPRPISALDAGQNLEMFASLAIGAFGAHELDYCDMTLRAADAFIATLDDPLRHSGIAMRITKLWKRQCDLLIRRGQLEDAEQYVRHRLRELGFYSWYPQTFCDHAPSCRNGKPMWGDRPAHVLQPPLIFPVWSRLLGRLGVVMRLRGGRYRHEALAAFNLARRLDDAFADYSSAELHAEAKAGLSGQASHAMVRLLCAAATDEMLDFNGNRDLAKTALKQATAIQPDPGSDTVDSSQPSIDVAVKLFAETLVNKGPGNLLSAAGRAVEVLDEAELGLQGQRMPGLELAHIPHARSLLLAQVLSYYTSDRLGGLATEDREILKSFACRVVEDSERVLDLVSTHDLLGAGVPWRQSAAPLFSIDASLTALVSRCFLRAHRTRFEGRPKIATEPDKSAIELARDFTRLRGALNSTGYNMRLDLLKGAETLASSFRPRRISEARSQDMARRFKLIFASDRR